MDEPCTVDEKGWCERHQTTHVGRLLELALEDSELGSQYRALWDHEAKIRKGELPTGTPFVQAATSPSPQRELTPKEKERLRMREQAIKQHQLMTATKKPCGCGK